MKNLKQDFPIFANNPGLVYLDSAATSLKPEFVTSAVHHYINSDYANIHRGAYGLSEKSEDMYHASKEIIASHIGGSANNIVYTYNSTYAINIIAQALAYSQKLKKGDKVLLCVAEHHANIVPWLILKKQYGIEVDYIKLDDEYNLDMDDFRAKYNDKVKVVSLTYASNVTGEIFPLHEVGTALRDDTYFIIDASQAIPHFQVDAELLNADFIAFTGHKMMAYTGIGVLRAKKEHFQTLTPNIGGGGSIQEVNLNDFVCLTTNQAREPGTPNLIGAMSMLKAYEYIDKLGGYKAIQEIESELVEYALQGFQQRKDKIKLLGSENSKHRLGVFSFSAQNNLPAVRIGELMALDNVCIRCGGHCAHPLHHTTGHTGTCRMSLYLYNDKSDIDAFFLGLDKIIS